MLGSTWRGALAVFCLALAVRGIYLWELRDSAFLGVLIGDARSYDAWARRIMAGDWSGGNEVFWQAPLYPYFMGSFFTIVGHDVWLLRLWQVMLGATSCSLLVWAGRNFFDLRTGFVAGLLLACSPDAIFSDALVQKPVLDLWLTTLLVGLLGAHLARAAWWWPLAAGLTLGLLILNRENARVLVPLVALWLWASFGGESRARRSRWIGVFVAGLCVALAPAAIRNYAIGGEFVVNSSGLGQNFFIGNNEHATGEYVPLRPGRGDPQFEPIDARELAEEAAGGPLSSSEISSYWLRRSWGYISAHPSDWLRLTGKKWGLLWNAASIGDTESIDAFADHSRLLKWSARLLHFGVLCPLAVLGLWASRHDWRRLWILYGSLAALALSVTLFFIFARYRVPMLPYLLLFAAAGVVGIVQSAREAGFAGMFRTQWSGLALAAVVGFYTNRPIDTQAMHLLTYRNYAQVHSTLGLRYQERGDRARAVQHYRWALSIWPATHIHAATANLAWILATSPEPSERNGAEAVAWIDQLGPIEQVEDPVLLDVMGAAYASVGRYSDAVGAAKKSIALAVATGNTSLARDVRQRLTLYERFQPAVAPNNVPPYLGQPVDEGDEVLSGVEQL
ncbi:MAG: glycosyltransferase family 39 protein [Pirellulales bacterium]|nr:glycosyltransferase family 39 protein [Pirellulales bacterium]